MDLTAGARLPLRPGRALRFREAAQNRAPADAPITTIPCPVAFNIARAPEARM